MMHDKKYIQAWEYLKKDNYNEGLLLLSKLADNNYYEATYDLAGINYYGSYGLEKNYEKALIYYEKSFLLSKRRKILEELLYVKYEKSGAIKTFFYCVFNKKIFSTLLISKG